MIQLILIDGKEKNKLSPKFNKNVSNTVIIDVLPSTIKRNLQKSMKKSHNRSTGVPSIESSSPAAERMKPNSVK
jgi:hypothetical protein